MTYSHYYYPQCEYAISVPVCYKTNYYIGWIRLGVWVGLPIIICLTGIMLLSAAVRKHQIKRMDSVHSKYIVRYIVRTRGFPFYPPPYPYRCRSW